VGESNNTNLNGSAIAYCFDNPPTHIP
jgi:hypothetical protein